MSLEGKLLEQVKLIMSRLDILEKRIEQCCGNCVDFTQEKTGTSKTITKTVGNHTFEFSILGGGLLEISSFLPDGKSALRIPQATHPLVVSISPSCKRITIEATPTKSADFKWVAYLNNIKTSSGGSNSQTTPFTFEITGGADKIEFAGSNESGIRKICCYCN